MFLRRTLTTIVSLTVIGVMAFLSIYYMSPLPLFALAALVLLASYVESFSLIEGRGIPKLVATLAVTCSFVSIAFLVEHPKIVTTDVFIQISASTLLVMGASVALLFISTAFTWSRINYRTAATENGMIYIHYVYYGILAPIICRLLLDTHYVVQKPEAYPDIYAVASGVYFFLGSILTAKLADIGAFLGGYFFGKKLFKGKKMAPRISPKKTIAGLLFGLVTSGVAGALLLYNNPFGRFHVGIILAFGIVVGLFSVGGDLFQSMLKRSFNIKDSGRFLPGIGGWFDLTDSIFWACPVAYALFILNYLLLA